MRTLAVLTALLLTLACSSDKEDKSSTAGASAGGSSGSGGQGGGPVQPKPVTCGDQECVPPDGGSQFGVSVCCTADNVCGIQTPLSSDCLEPGQLGGLDPACPDFTEPNTGIVMLGCCGPGGVCGALDTLGGIGCIPNVSLGAPEASCEYDPRSTCTDLKEVRCDGPEDCPSGKVCCGVFGGGGFFGGGGYSEVGCFDSCDAIGDAGASGYELCHEGQGCGAQTTGDGGPSICSQSPYLPPYLSRCYSDNQGPATPANASAEIRCGDSTCGSGEKCCLIDCSGSACHDADLPAPYCAPVGESCTCTGGMGPADAGGAKSDGGLSDSGASDAGIVDASMDGAG